MLLFLDTEFTDPLDCQLISIGIVSEDGHEFYAERTDFDMKACSPFVHAAVLPWLRREPAIIGNEGEVRAALLTWLDQFPEIEICVDHATDWDLFLDLCKDPDTLTLRSGIRGRNIRGEIIASDVERYWQRHGRKDHHALHDARANRFAFLARSAPERRSPDY